MSRLDLPDRTAATRATPQSRLVNQTLWRSLVAKGEAGAEEAWLHLTCAQVDLALSALTGTPAVITSARLLMAAPNTARYGVVARYGARADAAAVTAAAEKALASRQAAVGGGDLAGDSCIVAAPIIIDDGVAGAVALELSASAQPHLELVLRICQWGIAWFGWRLRPAPGATSSEAAFALDALRHIMSGPSLASGGEAVATFLCESLGARSVALGVQRHDRTRLLALSHGGFSKTRTTFQESLTAAMDEAATAVSPVQVPPSPDDPATPSAAHARLVGVHECTWATSVPHKLETDRGPLTLVWTVTGRGDMPEATRSRLTEIAVLHSPVVASRLMAEEPISRRARAGMRRSVSSMLTRARLPLPVLVPAALAVLGVASSLVTIDYEVTGDATLEGAIRRSIVAPFDGYIANADVRPGDRVDAGMRLARLDDRELRLQKLDLEARLDETTKQIDEALGQRDHAKVNILAARRDQVAAQLKLVVQNLARTVLTAPFAGYVVAGDKTQSIGAPLKRGDTLYEMSPLDGFRVAVDVPQSDFARIAPGQEGRLLLSSLPFESYQFRVERLSPVAVSRDGKTTFRVEGSLRDADQVVRPGMQGVARIDVGPHSIGWVLTHAVLDWLRIKLWTLVP